jgi:hypothetical protein
LHAEINIYIFTLLAATVKPRKINYTNTYILLGLETIIFFHTCQEHPGYNQSEPQSTGMSDEAEDGKGRGRRGSLDQYYLPYVQGARAWSRSIHHTIHTFGVLSVETRPSLRFMRITLDNTSSPHFPRATSKPVTEGQACSYSNAEATAMK